MTFQRENRYIVIKLKDLAPGQEADIREHLTELSAQPVDGLVIESDWPEYEPAWEMIQARMEGATPPAAPVQGEVSCGHAACKDLGEPHPFCEFVKQVDSRATLSPAHIEDEREACERWIRQYLGMPERVAMDWLSHFAKTAWAAWSARAALSAPPAAGVPEGFVDVMAAVFRELEHRHGDERGNAPRHSHTIPGVWDEDNGELAGKPCAWCALWNKGKEMLKAASTPTPTASEQQQPISDEEAVRILLSGGTLVFRVPHPVKGEGV